MMMKNFKKIVLSVLGMAVIATGFVACSNDDSNFEKNSEQEEMVSLKVTNQNTSEINKIVGVLSEIIDEKIKDPNLSDEDLATLFLDYSENMGLRVQNYQNLEEIQLSNNFAHYANDFNNTNFNEYTDYLSHLSRLSVEVNSDNNLNTKEKEILNYHIEFSIASLDMLQQKDAEFNKIGLSSTTTFGNGTSWWNRWGKCAAGVIGGGVTGGLVGCAGIGGLGAVVGGAAGLGVGSVPGAVVGGVAGCVVGGVAGWIGGALTGAATFCD